MCGRYAASARAEDLAQVFGIDPEHLLDRPEPSYNVAPTDPIPAVLTRTHGDQAARELRTLHWGLVPRWAADARGAARRINARAETVATRPAYRSALAARRCLLPADGYYEWATGPTGRRQPYFLRPPDGSCLAFAGLYERWRDPTGLLRWTATILTTAASGPLSALHDRMPMVAPAANWEAWLDPDLTNAHEAMSLPMSPCELLTADPVHPRVGSVREFGAGLIAPVEMDSEVLDFR